MKPFAALDQILNTRALSLAAARDAEGLAPAGDFQPLFAAGARGGTLGAAPETGGHGTPQIELVEADGRVQQIVVTCGCGERTVLDCAY